MNVKIGKRGGRGVTVETVWFWSVAGFFAAVWVLLPTLLHTGYCGDVLEMQSIAPQWVWAAKNHPALPSWILEILNIITCRSFAVPFIATQLCTLLALWSVWKLARTVLEDRLALIATFSVLPYLFFACKPVWFNHNNALIAFWALSIYLVFQAFQTNQKRYWISAGIALGLAFHAKYPAMLLVISILTYMFMRENGRKHFKTPGPYITTLIAFLIFLPHIVWLVYHDFPTITHAITKHPMPRWLAPLFFIGGQLLYLALPFVLLTPVLGFVWQWKVQYHEQDKARECEKFLFYCFIIPMVFYTLYGGIMGVEVLMEYGAPLWVFIGLWLLLRFQHATKETYQGFRQVVVLSTTIMLLIAAGFTTLAYLGQDHPKHYFPMRELGTACEQLWDQRFPATHCPYIAGRFLLCGHAAHAMSVRPSVILPQGTWATDDDLYQKGGIILWDATEQTVPDWVHHRFPGAEVLPKILELPYKTSAKIPPLRIGIAIVPPPEIP